MGTRYAPIAKLAQHVHVYMYVELVVGFATVRVQRGCTPAASNC
jgi:hypothetical protein